MTTTSQTELKKPFGIYILATLFILAPLGNIMISFAGSGLENWFDPRIFVPLMQSVPVLEWVWLGLLFLTGVLLFRPHKLSWSVAIFTLLIVLTINAYRLYNVDSNSIDPLFLKVFSLLAMIITLSVLVISFYFRFPYLDRRANWFSNTKRFNIRTAVLCAGIKSTTESLSETGCRISFDQPNSFKTDELVKLIFPDISKVEVQAIVIEKLEFGIRAEFKDLNTQFKQDLSRWLKAKYLSS